MKKVLIVSPVECYPNQYGNSARIASIIDILKQEGIVFHYLHLADRAYDSQAMSTVLGDRYTYRPYTVRKKVVRRLRWRAVQSLLSFRPHRLVKVDDFIDDRDIALYRQVMDSFQPDAVWINYTYLSKLLLYTPSTIKKIIDTHDSLHLRYQSLYNKGSRTKRLRINIRDEIEALNRANIVIGIQDRETQFFKEHGCRADLYTVGHQIAYQPCTVQLNRKQLLYIGAYYSANMDSLRYFLESIWPSIQSAIPAIRLVIAGGISRAFNEGQLQATGLEVRGFIDDLSALYQSIDVAINPVRLGSGLKIKNIEALSFGRPVVTTAVGAEGLKAFIGKGLVVADSTESWVSALRRLLYKQDYYENILAAGREEIQRYNRNNLSQVKDILKS